MASVSFFREPGWVMVYPVYLNNKLSAQQGRRLPHSKCVDNPTIQELFEACRKLGYGESLLKVEPMKAYSRDYTQRGRVQIRLKLENGDLTNQEIPNRKALFSSLASAIMELPTRRSQASSSAQASGDKGKKGPAKKGKK
eukprot:TRINITY_DN4126_c0_g1_i1.p1 TRINITY_DN4126_c0_g1~~TRINITY_DN4126_c0_g1_i1.p1  ORF type:complete len:140 (-),score=29.13 TRINITY_DN4126_c0_g1_i1:262-681(-)